MKVAKWTIMHSAVAKSRLKGPAIVPMIVSCESKGTAQPPRKSVATRPAITTTSMNSDM